ncbi:E3 ubiquitin-protein ligase [Tetrabaena socialis]|uniref:E3 ubiquitin-protein ligase n=1 Tax=Tetrabaena socialis TaxID=47790 RepID=A0A2J8AF72_9CHLO|nr:E3 ubiquitin-protein ligase [Tetrabaena socialis]PNH11167.1 E3 ubiquitin-protein ligase [Tetrabaena socialis]|eukprot:PNH11164.1 E3 ubiquitin-protein ligase [Tetrabaena socialis]
MRRTRAVREGDRPLHLAVGCGGEAAVEALLGHAATNVNAPNARGRTALYTACERGSVRCAELLVAHPRVDVDAGTCSALFAAIRVESPQLVRVLLDAGAEVDTSIRSGSGRTPLQYAAFRESGLFFNRATIMSLMSLIDAGAAAEPAMMQHAVQRRWYWVQGALQAGDSSSGGSGRCDRGSASSGGGGGGGGCNDSMPELRPGGLVLT